MKLIPHNTLVKVHDPESGAGPIKYWYGYVRKVEVTDHTTYFVQFHGDLPFKQFRPGDLTPVTAFEATTEAPQDD